MKKKFIRLFKFAFVFSLVLFVFIFISNSRIEHTSKEKTYSNTINVPKNKVGLLLGTSKYLQNGNVNLYYKYRIEAAVQLFSAKKLII